MTRAKKGLDKNLSNVVAALEQDSVNAHDAIQRQQDSNDRRHQDALNHDNTPDLDPTHS